MEWKDWQIIDNLEEDEELPYAPTEMWLINCFYFILKDANGRKFIPLVYPAYSFDKEHSIIKRGMWSTPYTALRIDNADPTRVVNISKIKRIYKNFISENKTKIEDSINYFFYYLGVLEQSHDDQPFAEFIEYKRSFSQNNNFKCYFVRNFYVYEISKTSKINIMDPDGLKGLYYMDLDHIDDMRYDEEKQFLYYQGRVLATNSTYIIKNKLLSYDKAINIDKNQIVYNEYGYIFMYDLNSSGFVKNDIEDSFLSFLKDGNELAEEFLSNITEIMTDAFNKYNIIEYKLEGDGFIASIPLEKARSIYDENEILEVIQRICKTINSKINQLLLKAKKKVSAKVTVCKGYYSYGKIGGLTSLYCSYSGRVLFELARMQASLAKYIHENEDKTYSLFYTFNSEAEKTVNDLQLLSKNYCSSEKESQIRINIYCCGEND